MTGGIYGKLPSAADFCRKRLPNTFVEPWDRWLQECLASAKETLGEAWSQTYLSSPLWCFAVDPGVVSEVGWTGVLATSVDSTGRYYPLTLAVVVEQLLPCQTLALHLQVPLRELEETALALIEGHQTIDDALALIDRIGTGLAALDTLGEEPSVFLNAYGGELGTMQANPLFPPVSELRRSGYSGYAPVQRPSNASIWWHYGWPGRSPEAVKTRGLPSAPMFGSFLDGRWKQHGWSR